MAKFEELKKELETRTNKYAENADMFVKEIKDMANVVAIAPYLHPLTITMEDMNFSFNRGELVVSRQRNFQPSIHIQCSYNQLDTEDVLKLPKDFIFHFDEKIREFEELFEKTVREKM